MTPFSLLEASWLPVRRRSGAKGLVRPAEIASGPDDPIVAFAWGRADFDAASREFIIGLLATACPPPANSQRKWEAWWKTPPTPGQLDEAFAPFAEAFVLDGDGPRFCQDFNVLEDAEDLPILEMLIEISSGQALFLAYPVFTHTH